MAQPFGGLDKFIASSVKNAPIEAFDDHGLGLQTDNLVAIGSLTTYRSLRFGRNVDLIITDNRTYRSRDLASRPEIQNFLSKDFPHLLAEEALDILDAGSSYNHGQPPQSMLGKAQKAWFLKQLKDSKAPWKLWGNSVGATDVRADLHNLPQGEGSKWPGASYGVIASDDWGGYRHERAQILDYIRDNQITGLVSLAGDRHAFSAGWLAASLPPKPFAPVGLEFVTGSVSAPGLAESLDHSMTPDKPWAAIFRQSAAAANPEVAPNLDLMDCGGHGYVVIAAHASSLDAELVCIPRPIQRANSPDGGPLRYRVSYRSPLWKAGEKPGLRRTATAGELPLGA